MLRRWFIKNVTCCFGVSIRQYLNHYFWNQWYFRNMKKCPNFKVDHKCLQGLAASLPGESPTSDTNTSLLSKSRPLKICFPRVEKNILKSIHIHLNSKCVLTAFCGCKCLWHSADRNSVKYILNLEELPDLPHMYSPLNPTSLLLYFLWEILKKHEEMFFLSLTLHPSIFHNHSKISVGLTAACHSQLSKLILLLHPSLSFSTWEMPKM